ncbi:hypothetical protein FAGKG844_230004 [Frankia sp. AgKG'84/4]
MRPVRRAAHRRRDRGRLRPVRGAVRLRPCRRRPRHHVPGQGAHRWLPVDGRDAVHRRGGRRRVRLAGRRVHARPDVHGQPVGQRDRERERRTAAGLAVAGPGRGDLRGPARGARPGGGPAGRRRRAGARGDRGHRDAGTGRPERHRPTAGGARRVGTALRPAGVHDAAVHHDVRRCRHADGRDGRGGRPDHRDLTDRDLTDRDLTDRDLTDRDLTDRDLTDRDLTDRRRPIAGGPGPWLVRLSAGGGPRRGARAGPGRVVCGLSAGSAVGGAFGARPGRLSEPHSLSQVRCHSRNGWWAVNASRSPTRSRLAPHCSGCESPERLRTLRSR